MRQRVILFIIAFALVLPVVPAQADTDSDQRGRPSASRSRSSGSRGSARTARSSRSSRSSKSSRSSTSRKSSSKKKSQATRPTHSFRSRPTASRARPTASRTRPTASRTRPAASRTRPAASRSRPTSSRSRTTATRSSRTSPKSRAAVMPSRSSKTSSRSKARTATKNPSRITPTHVGTTPRGVKQSPQGRVGTKPHEIAAARSGRGRSAVGQQHPAGKPKPGMSGNKAPGKKDSAWYNQHHGGKKPLFKHQAYGHHSPKSYRPGHGWYHQRHGHYYPVHRHPRAGWWYHRYRPAPVWGWWYPVVLPWHRYYYVYYGPNPWWLGYPVIVYEETVIVAEPEYEEEIVEWYEVPDESAWDDYSEYDSADATWDADYSEWVEVEGGEALKEGGDGWEIVEEEEGWYDPETGQVYDHLPADAVEADLTPEDTVPTRIAEGAGDFADSMETRIMDLINDERAAQGLEPLTYDARLSNAARQHSREMNDLEYFSHQSPTEEFGTLTRRLGKAGMKRYGWAGENIAMSTAASAEDFVKMWMDSPGHRENILRAQFKFTGLGVYGDGETFYATQVFSSQR